MEQVLLNQCNSLANIYSEQYLAMKYCYLELTGGPQFLQSKNSTEQFCSTIASHGKTNDQHKHNYQEQTSAS